MRDTLQINEGIFAKDGLSEIANNLQPIKPNSVKKNLEEHSLKLPFSQSGPWHLPNEGHFADFF